MKQNNSWAMPRIEGAREALRGQAKISSVIVETAFAWIETRVVGGHAWQDLTDWDGAPMLVIDFPRGDASELDAAYKILAGAGWKPVNSERIGFNAFGIRKPGLS